MKSARKVAEICDGMVEANKGREHNYAMLNSTFNGDAPWTDDEAKADHQFTNHSWLEGPTKIHEARSQAKNAIKSTSNYFTIQLDYGPVNKRREWGMILTKHMNRIMKRSSRYTGVIDSGVSQMIVQGIGPSTWLNRSDWCPKSRSIADTLVPTNTLLSLENLSHFALRTTYTAAELIKCTTGPTVDRGWNQKLASQALRGLKSKSPGENPMRAGATAVEWVEDFKENGAYYCSDKVAALHCFEFYSFDAAAEKWRRQILIDSQANEFNAGDYGQEFLYDNPNLSFGSEVSNILHAQIADGAVVAPAKWHSVRSLGYMLHPLVTTNDRLRCKFTDAVYESMQTLFRLQSEGQRELLEKIDIRHLGIIPDGLSWVPYAERNQMDYSLVSGAISMNRQLMSESSQSFTRDGGNEKEMTATEAMARLTSANKLQSAILANIYEMQLPQYREIAGRFCTRDHPDCEKFRKRCQAEGVDKAMFDTEFWDVIPEKAMGSGDQMLQIAMSDKLMSLSPKMSPRSQQIALHIAVEATTNDSAMANELVPLEDVPESPSAELATMAWGTLIDGKPVILPKNLNRIEFAETLFQLLDMEFKRINLGGGGPPDAERVAGLANVIQTLGAMVQQIAVDPEQQERVRVYSDQLGKAQNYLKGYAQQLQQAQDAAGQQGDPKVAAELQAMTIKAQAQAKIDGALAELKLRHKEDGFAADQKRRDEKAAAEISLAGNRAHVELTAAHLRNQLNLEAKSQEPQTPTN